MHAYACEREEVGDISIISAVVCQSLPHPLLLIFNSSGDYVTALFEITIKLYQVWHFQWLIIVCSLAQLQWSWSGRHVQLVSCRHLFFVAFIWCIPVSFWNIMQLYCFLWHCFILFGEFSAFLVSRYLLLSSCMSSFVNVSVGVRLYCVISLWILKSCSNVSFL